MNENEVIHASRQIVGKDNRAVIWRNNVGNVEVGKPCAKCGHRSEKPRRIAYGVGGVGGADYIGIVRETGRFIAWEFKGDGGRVSAEQQMFVDLINKANGSGEVIWTPDQVPAALERACRR